MRRTVFSVLSFRRLASACVLTASLLAPSFLGAGNWPEWRGPTGQGITPESDLPLRWSATEGVRWKAPLPGPGNSTPVVWGERVVITQAVDKGKERATLCFHRADGKLLWKRAVPFAGDEPTHDTNPYCSASPAIDGERIIVAHGSAGVFAYDLEGGELWRRDLGEFRHVWGNAASPVIRGERVFLNCGPGERTFLLALDRRSGKTLWQVDIPGGLGGGDSSTWTGSWSTPLYLAGPPAELVASFPERLRAFDPENGTEIWSAGGLGRLVYTSPLAAEGVVVAMSGYMGPPLAVRAGGKGDVTEARTLWREERAPQRVGSGVIHEGHIYILNDPGDAQCIELESGKTVWRERLGRSWSSMVLAGDRLYVPAESGDCYVLRASTSFELLAKSSLDETTRASIAVSDGELFLRTYRHLWCIGRERPEKPR
jgi:outer membrane protein assembly factor BamB